MDPSQGMDLFFKNGSISAAHNFLQGRNCIFIKRSRNAARNSTKIALSFVFHIPVLQILEI